MLQCRYENITQDEECFQRMEQARMLPDVITFNALIDAYGKSGKPQEAEECFQRVEQARVWPDVITFNALVDAYGKNGKPPEAEECFQRMEFNELIDAYGKSGKMIPRCWVRMTMVVLALAFGCGNDHDPMRSIAIIQLSRSQN